MRFIFFSPFIIGDLLILQRLDPADEMFDILAMLDGLLNRLVIPKFEECLNDGLEEDHHLAAHEAEGLHRFEDEDGYGGHLQIDDLMSQLLQQLFLPFGELSAHAPVPSR